MRSTLVLLLTCGLLTSLAMHADAADPKAEGDDDGGFFQIDSEKRSAKEKELEEFERAADPEPGTWRYKPACGLGGAVVCRRDYACGDGGQLFLAYFTPVGGVEQPRGSVCLGDEEAPEAARPQITNVMVLRALRRIPVPAAKLVVQPPGGKTLVNFETIFHTEAEPFNRTVTLLGQRVELEITPATFVWKHGDSTSQTTSTPGVAFAEGRPMSDYITHSYEQARQGLKPSVDTTYSARFRVNGGAWQDVIGTVTIEGDPVNLQVVEGRPALVNAY